MNLPTRIKAALHRIQHGQPVTRIPAHETDADVVLMACRDRIAELEKQLATAQAQRDGYQWMTAKHEITMATAAIALSRCWGADHWLLEGLEGSELPYADATDDQAFYDEQMALLGDIPTMDAPKASTQQVFTYGHGLIGTAAHSCPDAETPWCAVSLHRLSEPVVVGSVINQSPKIGDQELVIRFDNKAGFDGFVEYVQHCADWFSGKGALVGSKPKKLDQSIFDGAPDWVEYAAVTRCGLAKFYEVDQEVCEKPLPFWVCKKWPIGESEIVGDGFDASDWRNSLIKRERAGGAS